MFESRGSVEGSLDFLEIFRNLVPWDGDTIKNSFQFFRKISVISLYKAWNTLKNSFEFW